MSMEQKRYLGGRIREDWQHDGLHILYSDAAVLERTPAGLQCSDPDLQTLFSGQRPPANAADRLFLHYSKICFDEKIYCDFLSVLENFRRFLDEEGRSWEESLSALAAALTCPPPDANALLPLPVLEAVQPRLAALARVLDGQWRRRIGQRWPGDPRRPAQLSLILENQLRTELLVFSCAGCCTGAPSAETRALYLLAPEKFEV